MPISVVLLGCFPEAILLLIAGLTLIGEKLNPRRIIIAALLYTVSVYFIRQWSSYGIHMLYQSLVLFLLVYKIMDVKPLRAIFMVLIVKAIVMMIETVTMMFSNYILDNSFDIIMGNPLNRILHSIPNHLVLIVIAIISYDKNYLVFWRSRDNIKEIDGVKSKD